MAAGQVLGIVVLVLIVLFILITLKKAVIKVNERQAVIIEKLGKFSEVLQPGIHFIMPWISRPKTYNWRFYRSNALGQTELDIRRNATRVKSQNEVLDFPQTAVISRDNALISLDCILNYKIVNPKLMMYNTQNLPRMLSKTMQAQVRNVAGTLEVDQIIEEAGSMDRVQGEVAQVAQRWGVQVEFVKVQKVEAGGLQSVLAKKKNAELLMQEVIINARAAKQKQVIEAEGERDAIVRNAEGEAQNIRARARGEAKAILNAANAEAQSIRELGRALQGREIPSRYLLALKYMDALRTIASQPNTDVRFMPRETTLLQTFKELGLNTVVPSRA